MGDDRVVVGRWPRSGDLGVGRVWTPRPLSAGMWVDPRLEHLDYWPDWHPGTRCGADGDRDPGLGRGHVTQLGRVVGDLVMHGEASP